MKKIPVWIDCDAGVGDYAALSLAHSLKEFEILGISVLYGKTNLDRAYRNCMGMIKALGADYPVYCGAEKPLINDPYTGSLFCDEDVLNGVVFPDPEKSTEEKEHAWDALYNCAKEHAGELRLITLGPLTNIGAALMKYPELSDLLHSVTVGGGAAIFGDITPAAEFNIYVDPHSADIVFRAGTKMNVLFLEATRPVYFGVDDISEIAAGEKNGIKTLCSCLRTAYEHAAKKGLTGVSIGDTCPVMYLIHPEFFTTDEVGVMVETRGTITNGRTVTDAYSDKQFPFKNATVALGIDRDAYLSTLKKALKEL